MKKTNIFLLTFIILFSFFGNTLAGRNPGWSDARMCPVPRKDASAETGPAPGPTEAGPVISKQEAIRMALNRLEKTDEGFCLKHRSHTALFTAEGMDFLPKKGGLSWRWRLKSVAAGDRGLSAVDHGLIFPFRDDRRRRVSYERGGIVEQYLARARGIEQLFVIPEPLELNGADLVITGAIESSGEFEQHALGWQWRTGQAVVSLGRLYVFDAAGKRIPARMTVTARESRIEVDGSALAMAAYPVTIDPEVGANDFRISDMGTDNLPQYDAWYPAVAYNSTNNEYLVVWRGDDDTGSLVNSAYEIFGQRIDAATGAETGSDFRISDMGSADGDTTLGATNPAVAYNSTNNEYLVVWEADDDTAPLVNDDFEIFGQRIHGDHTLGNEVGENDIRISDMGPDGSTVSNNVAAYEPAVAYNSINNEYLVVWRGSDAVSAIWFDFEIYGQRIQGDRSLGDEVGNNDFKISNVGPTTVSDEYWTSTPAIAYNNINNEYLVVFRADKNALNDNEYEIWGRRVYGDRATGDVADADEFRLSDMGVDGETGSRAENPDVAYNSIDNEYLVVWNGDDGTSPMVDNEKEIFGQRVYGDRTQGNEVGTNDFRISEMGGSGSSSYAAEYPAVAYNAIDNQYLVVWVGDDNTAPLIDNENEVWGQFLKGDGTEIGTDTVLSDMGSDGSTTYRARTPADVAFNGTSNEFLIVWPGDESGIGTADNEDEIFGQIWGNPPTATIDGEPPSPTNSTTATLTVGGANVSHYKYRLDAGSYGVETPVAETIDLSGLADGTHGVFVIGKNSRDIWQSESKPTISNAWTVDTSAPTATISGTPTPPTCDTSATLTVGGSGVTHYKYQLDGGGYGASTVVATQISLSGLGVGLHTVEVIGRDLAGNWQSQATAAGTGWTVQAMETFYHDHDGDGYGDPGDSVTVCIQPADYVDNNMDCDDNDANVKPGAVENPSNGKDDDCDSLVDEGPPAAATNAATGVSATGATLNGTVDANDFSTTATFEYGMTSAYGTTVNADQSPVTGSAATAVSKTVSGLTPNATYHYRVVGQNAAGTINGTDRTFTTSVTAATVTTGSASGIGSTNITLNGTVNANNSSTTVTFEYGMTTAYGTTVTANQSPVTGGEDTAVSKIITGLTPNTEYHYRTVGQNAAGTTNGADRTFTTSATAATVATGPASDIGSTDATLNGTVNANNSSTTVTFEYGMTTAYGTTITATPSPVTGTADVVVEAMLTGLTPDSTYHYRVVGVNAAGTTVGGHRVFTTSSSGGPTVTTGLADKIGATGATLKGTVNANDSSTTVTFEYGTTTAYGITVTADQSPVTGSADMAVSAAITGLISESTYHFRVVGQNASGTTNGGDQTFTTNSPGAPTVTTNPASNLGFTEATLNGTVNANDSSTTVTFEYGMTTAYGNIVTADQSPVTGSTDTAVSAAIAGLPLNTTYHFRAVGQNASNIVQGGDRTFTTLALGDFSLNVNKSGTGSGTVTSDPAGIDCGSACAAAFYEDETVTLTAEAAAGSRFEGWSGDCSGTDPEVSVIMDADKTCTAGFRESVNPAPFITPLLSD